LRLRRGKTPRIELPLRVGSIHQVQAFVTEVARGCGWDHDAMLRLELATEEAILFLLDRRGDDAARSRLQVQAKAEQGQVQLELLSGAVRENFESALARVDAEAPPKEEETGLRILARLAERVRHQQFHGTDVLLVDVGSRPL
jgi:NCS2 family nucleobase:cation symporter-2/xanthine permease XanP